MGEVWWKDYERPEAPVGEWSRALIVDECMVLACRYLEQRGMEIVEQDWSCYRGAVPIIAKEEDGTVVLVDVRSDRKLDANSMPELEIDGSDPYMYRSMALDYLLEHKEVDDMRFDLVSVQIQGEGEARLRHLVGYITWEG